MPRDRSSSSSPTTAPDQHPIIRQRLLHMLIPIGGHNKFLRANHSSDDMLAEVLGLSRFVEPSTDTEPSICLSQDFATRNVVTIDTLYLKRD